MTPDLLEEIKLAICEGTPVDGPYYETISQDFVDWLIAEVESLRMELARVKLNAECDEKALYDKPSL